MEFNAKDIKNYVLISVIKAGKDVIMDGVVCSEFDGYKLISFCFKGKGLEEMFETSILKSINADNEGDPVRLIIKNMGGKVITQLILGKKTKVNLEGLEPLTPEKRKEGYIKSEHYTEKI